MNSVADDIGRDARDVQFAKLLKLFASFYCGPIVSIGL